MAGDTGFWSKVAGEARTVSERARGGARRAFQIGILRVDLVSLRRDRSRALADFGERALAQWKGGTLEGIETDSEAIRLRERIGSVERCIAEKRSEIDRLRHVSRAETLPTDSPPAETEFNAP
jgi:hypothetical protein